MMKKKKKVSAFLGADPAALEAHGGGFKPGPQRGGAQTSVLPWFCGGARPAAPSSLRK